jgi:hypothetical protein
MKINYGSYPYGKMTFAIIATAVNRGWPVWRVAVACDEAAARCLIPCLKEEVLL